MLLSSLLCLVPEHSANAEQDFATFRDGRAGGRAIWTSKAEGNSCESLHLMDQHLFHGLHGAIIRNMMLQGAVIQYLTVTVSSEQACFQASRSANRILPKVPHLSCLQLHKISA